ncbi:Na+-translocating NADH-quinone reductase subunit C [Haematobacter missouriensis]|uniref:NADH:ubiquinone reductase (Na(+)-transporting) subunit C n=1 Tax=Haematobacter missouriensis TaxID=366616 RepID=A0ABX3ZQA2_9RHOB|nr:Na+-translocating NADH-quinone reductase subunit C [Haematobacter missouriensis]OWJ73353.1 NADH:ubiquinone reductase (Na(+)-transporting) subunit C [Haematobacter missouriensis]
MRETVIRFFARPNTDPIKSIGMAMIIAASSALVVGGAAVSLRPLIEANRLEARAGQMAALLEGVPGIADLLADGGIETLLVDLTTGRISATDPVDFDPAAAATDPERSTALSPAIDLAAITRRENEAMVWLVRDQGQIRLLVLPVRGAGYQSTIYAYLALEGDLNTVAAFTVYEQGETPGLGSRVAETDYLRGWTGRQIAEEGMIMIDTVSGASGVYEVEMISGASVTSYGAIDMVHFWLGPDGFGPFIDNLRNGEAGL